jgi:hypothetical protein
MRYHDSWLEDIRLARLDLLGRVYVVDDSSIGFNIIRIRAVKDLLGVVGGVDRSLL